MQPRTRASQTTVPCDHAVEERSDTARGTEVSAKLEHDRLPARLIDPVTRDPEAIVVGHVDHLEEAEIVWIGSACSHAKHPTVPGEGVGPATVARDGIDARGASGHVGVRKAIAQFR
jgi:hypothetical protein